VKRDDPLDVAALPGEMKLLLALLRRDASGAGRTEIADAAERTPDPELTQYVDWRRFLELVRHHRVVPQLYAALKRDASFAAPPFVLQSLNHDFRANALRMLRLTAELERVNAALAAEGVRTLSLKGPALGFELYGDVSRRMSGDLDLLVPLGDLARAEAVLGELGYEKDDYIETVLNDWKWRHHHVNFVHSLRRTKVELHWRLHPGPAKEPGFDALWARRTRCRVSASPIFLPGKEDLFLFLAAHGARHGWSRLRWLADIDRLCALDISWTEARRLANRQWQRHLAGQSLALATTLLGAPRRSGMEAFAGDEKATALAKQAMFYLRHAVNLHTPPLPDYVAEYHRKHTFALMARRQKALMLLSMFHPYPSDAKLLPLPKSLHFLYFPLRPFLWAWRRTRNLGTTEGV